MKRIDWTLYVFAAIDQDYRYYAMANVFGQLPTLVPKRSKNDLYTQRTQTQPDPGANG